MRPPPTSSGWQRPSGADVLQLLLEDPASSYTYDRDTTASGLFSLRSKPPQNKSGKVRQLALRVIDRPPSGPPNAWLNPAVIKITSAGSELGVSWIAELAAPDQRLAIDLGPVVDDRTAALLARRYMLPSLPSEVTRRSVFSALMCGIESEAYASGEPLGA